MDTLLQTYNGHGFTVQYPADATLLESQRTNDTFMVRVLWLQDGIKYRYDIEKLSGTGTTSDLAQEYFRHRSPQPEDIAPEQITVNGTDAWHTRKVIIDGLQAILVYDAIFLHVDKVNYRFQYMAYLREFESGLPGFEALVHSFQQNPG